MIIKVCGLCDQNIKEIDALRIDWGGFIFYEKSPRKVNEPLFSSYLPTHFKRVGVFVNTAFDEIIKKREEYQLDYIQLHGDESPECCYALQERGVSVIKAFSIEGIDDLQKSRKYEGAVDYFLFDTKCSGYGGSGKSFDWSLLEHYRGDTPFLLSGGITPESIDAIRGVKHPKCIGIDLNSGFELKPGIKDTEKLRQFLSQLNNNH